MSAGDERRLVGLLLGPEGPELSCEQCFEQLDRYVELELAGADADVVVPGMRAHLAGCPACHEDRASLRTYVEEGPPDAAVPASDAAGQSGGDPRSGAEPPSEW